MTRIQDALPARRAPRASRDPNQLARELLRGRTIVGTITDTTMPHETTITLVLNDGAFVRVMCDPEGNGPGCLQHADGDGVVTMIGGR